MKQATAEHAPILANDDAQNKGLEAETIIIEHGEDGTTVEISDVTGWEVLALALIVVLAFLFFESRKRRRSA